MLPFYEHNGISIYNADCREVMPELGAFDCIVTDPPYGDTSLDWDRQVRGWMDESENCTRNVWCFGSLRLFLEMSRTGECSRWKLAQEIVWEKQNGSGFHADRFKRVHELAVQFYRGEWSDVYKSPVTTPDALAKTSRRKKRPTHMGDIGLTTFISHDGGPRLMRSVIYEANCHGFIRHRSRSASSIRSCDILFLQVARFWIASLALALRW